MASSENDAYRPAAEVRRDGAALGLIALMLVAGLAVLHRLPARVVVHWNAAGQPNGWSSPALAALLPPLAALAVWALLLLAPVIDPRRRRYVQFAPTYRTLRLAVVAVVAALDGFTLAQALGAHVDVPMVAALVVSLLMLLIGNVLPRLRPTWFLGIRTPWTLSDEEVWRRTHRWGGRLFMVAALVPLLGLWGPPRLLASLVLASVLVPAVASAAYSYVVYAQLHRGRDGAG